MHLEQSLLLILIQSLLDTFFSVLSIDFCVLSSLRLLLSLLSFLLFGGRIEEEEKEMSLESEMATGERTMGKKQRMAKEAMGERSHVEVLGT